MVCYFENWAQYRKGDEKMLPKDIDPFLCTHVIYSFAKVEWDHKLGQYEWNDESKSVIDIYVILLPSHQGSSERLTFAAHCPATNPTHRQRAVPPEPYRPNRTARAVPPEPCCPSRAARAVLPEHTHWSFLLYQTSHPNV